MRYLDMDNIEEDDPCRVKIVVAKIKSHVALWWDNLQASRRR
jgi:hypothetical protein